jgi:hypothetical protein
MIPVHSDILLQSAAMYTSVGNYGNFPLLQVPNLNIGAGLPTAKRIGIDVPCFHVGTDDSLSGIPCSSASSAPLTSPGRSRRKSGASRNRSTSCVGLSEDGTSLPTKKGIVKSKSYSGAPGPARPRSKSTSSKSSKSSSNLLSSATSADSYDKYHIGYELDIDGELGLGHDFPIDWLDTVVSGMASGTMSVPMAVSTGSLATFHPSGLPNGYNHGNFVGMESGSYPHMTYPLPGPPGTSMFPNTLPPPVGLQNYPYVPHNGYNTTFLDHQTIGGLQLNNVPQNHPNSMPERAYSGLYPAYSPKQEFTSIQQLAQSFPASPKDGSFGPQTYTGVSSAMEQQLVAVGGEQNISDPNDSEIQAMALDLAAWLVEGQDSAAECKTDSVGCPGSTTPPETVLTMHANIGRDDSNISLSSYSGELGKFQNLSVCYGSQDISPKSVNTGPVSSQSTPSPPIVFYGSNGHQSNSTSPWQMGYSGTDNNSEGSPPAMGHVGQIQAPSPSPLASQRNFFREPPTLTTDPFSDETEAEVDPLEMTLNANTIANSGTNYLKSKRNSGSSKLSRSNLFAVENSVVKCPGNLSVILPLIPAVVK